MRATALNAADGLLCSSVISLRSIDQVDCVASLATAKIGTSGAYTTAKKDSGDNRMAVEIAFEQAFKDNKIDRKYYAAIMKATREAKRPGGKNQCENYVLALIKELPERDMIGDFVKGTTTTTTVKLSGPGKKTSTTITGLQISEVAWHLNITYKNLWNWFGRVDSHYAIKVTFPDKQTFYFDDGDWGVGASRIFAPKDIRSYAALPSNK